MLLGGALERLLVAGLITLSGPTKFPSDCKGAGLLFAGMLNCVTTATDAARMQTVNHLYPMMRMPSAGVLMMSAKLHSTYSACKALTMQDDPEHRS